MKDENIHQQIVLENNGLIDTYLIYPGIYVSFNRIYSISTKNEENSRNRGRTIIMNFCLNGRCDVAFKNGKYALVKEKHLSLSTIMPNKDFYFPGKLYEGIEVHIDLDNPNIKKGRDFFSMLGASPIMLEQVFCESNKGVYLATANEEIMSLVNTIWEMKDDPDIPMIRYLLVSIFHKISGLPKKSELEKFFTKSQIAIVKEAEQIITRDFSRKYSAGELAAYFGVSETSFKQYIKGVLGEGYLPYFRRKRMEKAAELLKCTNMKVIEVANSVGYENQGKFAKVFAEHYTVSPLEYRRLSK